MKKILKSLVMVALVVVVMTAFTGCDIEATIRGWFAPDPVEPQPDCVHEVVTDEAVEPSCTEKGLTEGYHCALCDLVILPQYDVKALGHKVGENGKAATCTEAAVCGTCEQSFGEALGHNFADATCVAPKTCKVEGCGATDGEPDPENHSWIDATCTEPKLCPACGATEGDPNGHTWTDATCTAPKTCSVCQETEGEALGHTFVEFVTTLPTADAPGYTVGKCSVEGCEGHTFGEVKAMGAGTYALDMTGVADLSASGDAYDGQVIVLGDWFAAHLSLKYRTDGGQNKTFDDGYTGTVRMNWGGNTAFVQEVDGENKNILRNGVEFTTLGFTTVKVHWVCGGDGRQLALYDMKGNIVAQTNAASVKNSLYISELVVPAGSYVLGNVGGNNYYFAVNVTVGDVPAADSEITLPAANAIGSMQVESAEGENDAYTTDKYYVSGVITNIDSTKYGNMTIVDENGNTFYIYGVNAADGTRYDGMESKPVVGDSVKLYGIVGNYKGDPQMKSATLIEFTHEHKYSEATCKDLATCACGLTTGELAAHNYAEGKCTVCQAADPDYVPDPDAPVEVVKKPTWAWEKAATSYATQTWTDDLGITWTATGSAINKNTAGTLCVIVANPKNTEEAGTLRSSVISDGIKSLSFTWDYPNSDSKGLSFTLNIYAEDGTTVLATKQIVRADAANKTVYTETVTLDTAISGNFIIELVNNQPTGAGHKDNKDRAAIYDLSWVANPAQ